MSRGWIKPDEKLISFAWDNEEVSNKGAYINLMKQLNRLAKHTKGGLSIKTQRQYYNHMDIFTRYLADEWGLQNLANISGRHMAAFVEERQADGMSASTVDLDLAAIRYFHDQYGGDTRNRIPDNRTLCQKHGISLDPRTYGKVNRRWSDNEVTKMVDIALRLGRPDISKMIQLGIGLGFRIHEVTRISGRDVEIAIKNGFIHIKGKNGLERDVPLRSNMPDVLKSASAGIAKEEKLFVPVDRKTHEVIQSVQSFIINHRAKAAEPHVRTNDVPITFHGLRHRYVFDRYQEFINEGFLPAAARYKVAQLIGHSREEITRIYLAGLGDESK